MTKGTNIKASRNGRKRPYTFVTDRIEIEAAKRGWDRSELAKRAGVSKATVCHVLAHRFMTPPTVKKLARAVVLDIADLVVETIPLDPTNTTGDTEAAPEEMTR